MTAHPVDARSSWEELGQGLAGPVVIYGFVAAWAYCTLHYGFLLGFGLGWLPAGILAALAGYAVFIMWPVALALVGGGIVYSICYVLALFGLW